MNSHPAVSHIAHADISANRPVGVSVEASREAAEIKKRSVVIAGHRTSISLENAFWDALRRIAAERDISVNQLVTEIDRKRQGNLSSAIRTHVLLAAQAMSDG